MFQFQYSFQRDLVHIFAEISIGALGAPTLVSGKGVASVSRLSAGKLRIALENNFSGVMVVTKENKLSAGAPAAPIMVVRDESMISDLSSPRIDVEMLDTAGVATDPASGEVIKLHLILKNTPA